MKGIYLGAYKAAHPNYNIVYQDLYEKRDIGGCMLEVDLDPYDFIIATPPCNFWSHARGNRKPSRYALETAHLLPGIIERLYNLNKPFIVENVRNKPKFIKYGILPNDKLAVYYIGRHTYWTNVLFNTWVNQSYDFININGSCVDLKKDRQGGENVYNVIESWLKEVNSDHYIKIL